MAKNGGNKHFSASHIMLYVILLIYVIVAISGILFLRHCIDAGDMETAKVVFATLASMTTVCGSATAGFYVTKASRENVLQIKYAQSRMRLKLAKRLFKELENKTLDEKSLQLLQTLLANDQIEQMSAVPKYRTATYDVPAGVSCTNSYSNYSDEKGVG